MTIDKESLITADQARQAFSNEDVKLAINYVMDSIKAAASTSRFTTVDINTWGSTGQRPVNICHEIAKMLRALGYDVQGIKHYETDDKVYMSQLIISWDK